MAAGSQKWNGTSADLLIAPASTNTIAVVARPPVGAAATIADIEVVPTCAESMMMPTSMARPPKVVTSSACNAAPRLSLRL